VQRIPVSMSASNIFALVEMIHVNIITYLLLIFSGILAMQLCYSMLLLNTEMNIKVFLLFWMILCLRNFMVGQLTLYGSVCVLFIYLLFYLLFFNVFFNLTFYLMLHRENGSVRKRKK
jgi:hypothetical protein